MSFSIFNSRIWTDLANKEQETFTCGNSNPKEVAKEILSKLSDREENHAQDCSAAQE